MLQLEEDGKTTYRGQVVAWHVHHADHDTVEIKLTYRTPPGDWMVPLTYLAIGLGKIEPPPPSIVLKIMTSESDIEEQFNVRRFLIEKTIRRDGYIWEFHKADPDPWPSALHGHDYEKGLKIDAITGDIFDANTRQRCKTLKRKSLAALQQEILACKDLKELALVSLSADPS